MPDRRSKRRLYFSARQLIARFSILLGILLIGSLAGVTQASEPRLLMSVSGNDPSIRIDHGPWSSLLKAHVQRRADGLNLVDYGAFKQKGHARLRLYVRALESANLAQLDRPEQFALLVNLYNAKTLDIVLDRYPVKSIKEINLGGGILAALGGGPWKAKVTRIAGVALSLDDIEHEMLRPVFRDPRVHYAVNCASVGCPNLRAEAFVGTKLQAQLDAAAQEFINHPRAVNPGGGRLVVSSIYQWYRADFGGDAEGVLRHLRQFARAPLAQQLKQFSKIDEYQYDWGLNGTP